MKLLLVLAAMVVTLPMSVGYGLSPEVQSQAGSAGTATPTIKICSEDGTINLDQAHRLRDYLQFTTANKEQLLEISNALGGALRQCSVRTSLDAEIVGNFYVTLGNRLILEKEYLHAKQTFSSADQLFSQFGSPSLMWLIALQGEAQAELLMGSAQRADTIASNQTNMAREWVQKQRLASGALIDAMRFEAKICNATNQPERATQLLNEASRLESSENAASKL
jgi:hypothetical protein